MMRTTDDLGMLVGRDIFHGLCCEFGAGSFDSEPYRSPGQWSMFSSMRALRGLLV